MNSDAPFFQRGPVRVIAHRGGAGLGPENSLVAIERSLTAGADVLEVDVRRTRDGEFILQHDPDLRRVAGLDAAPEDLLAMELRKVDLRPRWRGTQGVNPEAIPEPVPIPTLREALSTFPDARFSIDVKIPHRMVVRDLLALARQCDAEDRILLGSFHEAVVWECRRNSTRIPTNATAREIGSLFFRSLVGGTPASGLPYAAIAAPPRWRGIPLITQRFTRLARESGVMLSVWTINDPQRMNRFYARGVEALVTDFPDQAVTVLQQRQANPG